MWRCSRGLHSLLPAVVALIASAGIVVLVSAFWGEGAVSLASTDWRLVLIFALCLIPLRKSRGKPCLGDGGGGGAELDTQNFIRRDAGDRGLR